MNHLRYQASDCEFAVATSDGAVPYADIFRDVKYSIKPDSSNGEFETDKESCCAWFLDKINYRLISIDQMLREHGGGLKAYYGAFLPVDKKMYAENGTPRSLISGCNPSRHAKHDGDFIRPFDRPYEDVLFEHGTPIGSHIHCDLNFVESAQAGLFRDEKTALINHAVVDPARTPKWILEKILMALVPTLYIMRSSGDLDGIRKRFQLLPVGYFRVKKYGVEFKDFPSTILRSPAYAAAAFMSMRCAILSNWIFEEPVDVVYDIVQNVDIDYITKLAMLAINIFNRIDVSYGGHADWSIIASRTPRSISEEWQWRRSFTPDRTPRETHHLGLISSALG